MKFHRINAETLREKVYHQLRRSIVSGQILPGESISLRALAASFGVSSMPVREAIWQLESERVVVVEPNRRIRVNQLSVQEMEELLEVRLRLESLAVEKSCARRPDIAIQRIKTLLEELGESIENPRKYLSKNHEFHFGIYAYAESPLVLTIIDGIWARVGPYIIHAATSGDLDRSMAFHWQMFEGFATRDADLMVAGLRGDLQSAAEFIIPHLELQLAKDGQASI